MAASITDIAAPDNNDSATSTANVADAPLTAGTLTLSSGSVEGVNTQLCIVRVHRCQPVRHDR